MRYRSLNTSISGPKISEALRWTVLPEEDGQDKQGTVEHQNKLENIASPQLINHSLITNAAPSI